MRRLAILLAVIPVAASAQVHKDFSVELDSPLNGLRQCQVAFDSGIPKKKMVDELMEQAMQLCATYDPGHDVQVTAFRSDGALDKDRESYSYLVHHTNGHIERITFQQELDAIGRDMRKK